MAAKRAVEPLRKACVVGMGTAGAATALMLARTGKFEVTMFEKDSADHMHHARGAGIGLQPIGLRVLETLGDGTIESILRHGAKVDSLLATTVSGKEVLNLRYEDFHPSLFGLGLHRSVLNEHLLSLILKDERIKVHMGREVIGARIAHTKSEYHIDPAHSYLKFEGGSFEGPFDLIIGADGRSSALRRSLKPFGLSSHEMWYNYGCVWAVLPDTVGFLRGQERRLTQRLDGTQKMLGFLPTGHSYGDLSKEPLVSLFWSLDMSKVDQFRAAGIDKWKEEIIRMEPRAEGLINQIESHDDLIEAYYSNVLMPKLYFGSSCVFIGDAAHAVSPQLGQGTNLALVDAMYLTRALKEADFDIARALKIYDQRRKWRLRFYQLNSVMLTPIFQANSSWIGPIRDAVFSPLCKFPITRNQMLATLTGAQKNGIPFSYIPEDEYVLQSAVGSILSMGKVD